MSEGFQGSGFSALAAIALLGVGSVSVAQAQGSELPAAPHMTQVHAAYEQDVRASCDVVFATYEDRSAWLSGFDHSRPTSPPSDYQWSIGKGENGWDRYERQLQRVPGRLSVIGSVIGDLQLFAVFEMRPIKNGCHSAMSVSFGYPWPKDIKTEVEAHAAEAAMMQPTLVKIASDQQRLKFAAEKRSRR